MSKPQIVDEYHVVSNDDLRRAIATRYGPRPYRQVRVHGAEPTLPIGGAIDIDGCEFIVRMVTYRTVTDEDLESWPGLTSDDMLVSYELEEGAVA